MQVIIEIPESEVPKQQDIIEIPLHFINGEVCEAGGYGFMELPKGHGRLIDEKEVYRKFYSRCLAKVAKEVLDETSTIIEADNKYEAKVITRGNCMMCGKELTEGLFFCKECKDKGKRG